MASGGDVVELVHEQTYLGQVVNNVYYFEAIADGGLIPLATWFELNVVPDVKACQVDLVTHTNLRLRNLYNIAETYEEPLTGVGGIVSGTSELPSFMAYTIRLDHDTGGIRPGFKRFCGVEEASITDSLVTAPRITSLEQIGANLVNPPADANANWAHVIVARICEEGNPIPNAIPACLKYRLPATAIEGDYGYPTSYEVYAQPTTQNSRKWYT